MFEYYQEFVSMKCSKCGCEIENNSKICPNCNAKVNTDKFPVWVIVLLILFCSGFFVIPVIGLVAALTIPSLVVSTDNAKARAVIKKEYAQFNQALLMGKAISDKEYIQTEDILEKYLLEHLNLKKADGDILILADDTEFNFTKISDTCSPAPTSGEYSSKTACAKFLFDVNGFDKGLNKKPVSVRKLNDRFVLLLYFDKIVPESGSIEDKVLNNISD